MQNKADSIILQFLQYRDLYRKNIEKYEAQVYIKGNAEVKKKNILFNYAPDFFYLNKKNDNSFIEAIIDVEFTAPRYYTEEIKALNGYRVNAEDIAARIMPFLNINIYNPTIFDNQILLPDEKRAFRYYKFEYINSLDTLGKQIHEIKISPKIKSQKLVSGYFYIVDKVWTIYKFDLGGRVEFADFRVETEFGLPPENFLLPERTTIRLHLNLLGNEVMNVYNAIFQYESITLYDWEKRGQSPSYDLSDYFSIQKDSLPIIKDSLFWTQKRPVPLTEDEETLYEAQVRIQQEADSASGNTIKRLRDYPRGIFTSKKITYNNNQFNYSGLINPLNFSYSKMDGIAYWQRFSLIRDFKDKSILKFSPDIGFLLQKDQVYFNIPVEWIFTPEKLGSVRLSLGNSNQSFNSTIINSIKEVIPDSIDFDEIKIDYFKHYQLELSSQYELANGLLLHGGVDYDWYISVTKGKSAFSLKADAMNGDVQDILSDQYKAFSPVIGLRWTPGQYYRFNGKRKEYLGSRYPTFSAEYARGIEGILGSNSNYERIEMDIQQKIPVGLLRSFHYYIGAGWFTHTESVYFADFKYFRRRNIPQSWNDPIGGVFHLLRSDWYNASNSYFQAHFMYESPFAFLQLFRGITKDILQERIYLSHLYTPVLPSYTEIGYGVGNFLGNIGVFMSLNKGKVESVGAKIAFDVR